MFENVSGNKLNIPTKLIIKTQTSPVFYGCSNDDILKLTFYGKLFYAIKQSFKKQGE